MTRATRDLEADKNWQVANAERSVRAYARKLDLLPGEKVVFSRYKPAIEAARVLDIGVGAGRTTRHLLGRCRSYKAIDYAPAMIDACREQFAEYGSELFAVGDARDLSSQPTGGFDFVLFSYCGIDCVDHGDRLRVLEGVKRILVPGGLFLFSSHSLHAFPFPEPEIQARNQHVNLEVLERQGWHQLVDRKASVVLYYIYPHIQRRQLEDAEFEPLDVIDANGDPFDFAEPPKDWLVHYLCRRK